MWPDLIGGSLEFAVPDGCGRMYVNVEDKNEIVVLDTRSRKLLSRFPLASCDGPTGTAAIRRHASSSPPVATRLRSFRPPTAGKSRAFRQYRMAKIVQRGAVRALADAARQWATFVRNVDLDE